jgi:HSP20 family molecular chaperone IbpA
MIGRTAFPPRPADASLQRFLQSALNARPATRRADYTVVQNEASTTLQLDLPGLSREQLDITIEGNVVRLQNVEGAARQVRRAWELPEDIDAAASTAKLENGVLTLTLAKAAPASKAVQLPVH